MSFYYKSQLTKKVHYRTSKSNRLQGIVLVASTFSYYIAYAIQYALKNKTG